MAIWNVSSEASLRTAIKASAAGDTILVQAGDYYIGTKESGRFDIKIDKSLNIIGEGGRANFHSDGHRVEKGIFNLALDKTESVSFDNIGFFGAHNTDLNGSGIRQHGGNLNVTNSYFGSSDSGILSVTSNEALRGNVVVTNSEFDGLGTNGYSHAMYVLANDFIVEGNNIHDTLRGHHVKSLASNTVVRDNVLDDGDGTSSYSIDVGAGGSVLIEGNTIIQGINGENPGILSYASNRLGGVPGAVTIQKNHIQNLSESPFASLLRNTTDSEIQVRDNIIDGLSEARLFNGLFNQSGNILDGVLLTPYSTNHNATSGTWGDDVMTASGGKSSLSLDAGAGNDIIFGNNANDMIFAGGGDDIVYSVRRSNFVYGEDGNDTLLGGRHKDSIFGQSGDDIIFDVSGANLLSGGAGNDLIFGTGRDTINGDAGNDILIAGGQFRGKSARLSGGDGDDILFGRGGKDIIHGGKGIDIAVYAGNFADYVVTEKYGKFFIQNIAAPLAVSDTRGLKESIESIEILQFSDGYLEMSNNVFHKGGEQFSYQEFMNQVRIMDTLTYESINDAPLDAALLLRSTYTYLFDLI